MKRTPARGVKKNLKPCASMPWEGQVLRHGLTACLLEYDPASYPMWQVKPVIGGATVKASLKRAFVASGRPETA